MCNDRENCAVVLQFYAKRDGAAVQSVSAVKSVLLSQRYSNHANLEMEANAHQQKCVCFFLVLNAAITRCKGNGAPLEHAQCG
jgi:hypothetical protein